jgi:hypothetical protein
MKPAQAAEQARKRALAAGARAEAAIERAKELKRRRSQHSEGQRAEETARIAAHNDLQAADSARAAHKQAADLHEQRADDLAGSGEERAARKAHRRADDARECEHHTG